MAGLSHGGGGGTDRVRSKSTSAAFGTKGAKGKGPFARWLDLLSPGLKFAVLVSCVMVSFGLHNILQVFFFFWGGGLEWRCDGPGVARCFCCLLQV